MKIDGWLAAMGVLRPLRMRYPGVEISWVGVAPSRDLLEKHPAIMRFDEILPEREGAARHIIEGLSKNLRPDVILHLHDSKPLPLGACSGVPVRAPSRWASNAATPLRELMQTFLSVLPSEAQDQEEPLWVHLADESLRKLGLLFPLLTRVQPFFVLDPGVEKNAREWPPEYWAYLGEAWLARGHSELVVVGADPGEHAVVRLFSQLRDAKAPFHLLSGQLSPMEFGWLLRKAEYVVTTRASTAWLASATGGRCVWIGGSEKACPVSSENSAPPQKAGRVIPLPLPAGRRKWHEAPDEFQKRTFAGVAPSKVIEAIDGMVTISKHCGTDSVAA